MNLAELEIRVESLEAKQAEERLDALTRSGGKAEQSVKGVGTASARTERELRQINEVARQAQRVFAAVATSLVKLNNLYQRGQALHITFSHLARTFCQDPRRNTNNSQPRGKQTVRER